MKKLILLFSIIFLISCQQKTNNVISKKNNQINEVIKIGKVNQVDSTPTTITKSIFNNFLTIDKYKDSAILFNQYSVKIDKNYNPIYITFRKCSPFLNKEQFNNNFNLLDSTDWHEEALIHKHFFYKKEGFIFIVDTYNDQNLTKENRCENNKNEILQKIRIFKYPEYISSSRKTNRSTFSKKIN